jgi:hypothetical protein
MTEYIKKLPAVFQTTTEKKFFDATFDQLFSKKDSSMLAGFLGRRNPGSYNPIADFYLPEPSKNRTWWQLEATAYARDADSSKTNVFFYEDLLERIQYYGGSTLNQDRLFESEYYSFGPPIDYDMFLNYQNYYWVEQGLSPITITGIISDDILGKPSYTTPPSATPPNFTLSTGMSILLPDDILYPDVQIVENMGGCIGITLVPQYPDFTAGSTFEFLPWDGTTELSNGRIIENIYWDGTTWEVEPKPGNADYITIERGALDQNAWSRTNKWFHIDTINATIAATNGAFPPAATRALRPIIQFIANIELYNSGTQFLRSISYGFADASAGVPILLADVQGQDLTTINSTYSIGLKDGDFVIFFNDLTQYVISFEPWDTFIWDFSPFDSGIHQVLNQYVFRVDVQPDDSVQFTPVTSYATPVSEGDIVLVLEDGPFNSAQRGQSWYYSNGVWQEAYNDKITTNQPPLFQLYDHNDYKLNDPTVYPGSNFQGSKIFSYSLNDEPGAAVDPVLKFPIVYTSLGQASDIMFDNDLITQRYTYSPALLPEDGYYYYKTTTSPILFNNWNLYDICTCDDIVPPNPCNCIEVSKQRVIDKFTVGYGTNYQFKMSVTPYGYPSVPDLIVSVNGIEVKPFTEAANGYTFETINSDLYVNLTTYLTELLINVQSVPPVVELQTYTRDLLNPEAKGYFEIPQQLEANPTQLEIGEISGSDLIQHFSSIIANQINFTGSSFGGKNNYRDSRKNRSLGSYILQNLAPALKSMLVSSSDDLDFVTGVRFSSDEYTKFKNKFLTIAKRLIDTEFNPVAYYNNNIVVNAWVTEILKTVNVSKEFSNAFAYSYMVASGTPFSTETITIAGNMPVTLTNYITLTDPKNVMYIYDITAAPQERLLVVGQDYDIISTTNNIQVQLKLGSSNKTLVFYLYQNPLPTYIPSTPTKLGTYGTFLPRIELDTSYAIPTNVIIGHDGSKTIAYNDYRDQLLLELELRIYNGIQAKFNPEYALPLRVETVKSGFYRQTRYSREEFLDITESYLNKWSAKYRANYRTNDWAVQNPVTPSNQLWKLYNYRYAVTPAGAATDLPGNWKGIFQYYYDTYYPDTRPWEMLGFSQQPSWWITHYGAPILNLAGQEVWPSTATAMWNDLEAGIIREGPTAIFDPITLQPQPQETWARPDVIFLIPVDAAGELIPITTLFGLSYSGNPYAPFDHFDEDWIYGDGGPVEQAWMSTSAYAYSIQEFLYLMRPGPFGELLFDTLGTELSPGTLSISGVDGPVQSNINWQYVQNEFYESDDPFFAWFRPKNKDQVVHAEIVDGITEIRFGYQVWISDRILFLGKNIADTFGQKVRTLDVNLANKLAGFTNKDTTNTYISSITPGASTNSLIIPSTNFDVLLHKSPPVDTYSYSGIIIRALANGTFAVYGYDLLHAEFTTLNRATEGAIDVSIGGTPSEFLYFTLGATYNIGDIVRYNGAYYESKAVQIAITTFNSSAFIKLRGLPTVGGISVSYYPFSKADITKVPYGTVFKTPQEVFDLMIGYGAWLETQGWKFDEVSPDTNQVSNWLASAKQFLFWLNTNWAPDASIQLSPLANRATLQVSRGYPDDVETLTNGVYSILDKNGVAISPQNTVTDRTGPVIIVEPASIAAGGIYFLQVNASETEHVLIFDNSTSFNDTIYSPLLRSRQQRLRFNGFRSNGWYGKMEAPGYLVMDNQLVPNYDTIVDAMRYYYDPNVTIDNPSLEDLGRHLIGYESKSYLDNLQVSNDVQYLFYQGAIRQKGTQQAFDKLFRSTKIQSNEIIEVFEEWALRLGKFGNTIEQVSTEFILKPEQNTGEVIVARLNFVPSTIGFVKEINILNAENTYINIPRVVISAPDADPTDLALTETPRQAKAFIILDSENRISRVDVTDGGYGYLTAPTITINSGAESHALDSLYSVWQGVIIKDETLDNVVNIDIDQTDVWVVRPPDPSHSLEFPETKIIDYPIPNAGYVNFNDVDFYSFNVDSTTVTWGSSTNFNPVQDDTIWIANNFIQDWNVYKLITAPFVDIIENAAGTLYLRTSSSLPLITPQNSGSGNRTDFGNIIVLQVIEAHASAVVTSGAVSSLTLAKTGAGYDTVPTVTIAPPSAGTTATARATIAGGQVTGFVIINPGSGYSVVTPPVVTISPPNAVDPNSNYAVGFVYNADETTADPTYYYYDLVNTDGEPIESTDIPMYSSFTKMMLFKTMRFLTPPAMPSYAVTGDKIWVDNNGDKLWTVFKYLSTGRIVFRQQEPLIDASLFESATVFAENGNQLVLLPIYDPFKNILPGPARQNLSYMSLQDPARYNVTGDTRLFSENIVFGEQQVGRLWWDLSSTRFVYYEQPMALDGSETEIDNLVYRRDRWAQVFPGSVIQIYEWVKSPVPPAQYTGSGIPRDITSYVQIITSNRFTSSTEINYYFWVLGSTDKPNIENRTLAATDVSRLLQSPKSQGFTFFAPIQQTVTDNSYMFYNVQEILAYQGDNIQIQYRLATRNDQRHAQWSFFREGDPNSLVTDQFWNKLVDSICGYTKEMPLTEEFDNPIIIPAIPDNLEILAVPDPTLSTGEKYGIEYRPRQSMFVNLPMARKVFVQAANSLLQYIPIRDNNPNWNIAVPSDDYWTYTNWYKIGYENTVPTIVYPTLMAATVALAAGQLQVGTVLQVTNGTVDGRYALYVVVQLNPNVSTLSLDQICIQDSAIKLLDTIYTVKNKYGLSLELRALLNAFRTQVFIDADVVDQNELFFSMMNFVVSEQKNPDWLFKTSYIYIKENNLPLTQDQLYIPDQISNIIDYIIDAKPYHTQIRDYTSTYIVSDVTEGTASDSYKWALKLQFGPDFPGNQYYVPTNIVDPMIGWDLHQGPIIEPWDSIEWDVLDMSNVIAQFISRNNIGAENAPDGPWPDTYQIELTNFDPTKIGYSMLYPYTFDFSSLNIDNPQTFMSPSNIVAIQIQGEALISGQDYYVTDNGDGTYTAYFFNEPYETPLAFIWIDGGELEYFDSNIPNSETANVVVLPDLVINVDTKLPVNTGITPYVGYGDYWDGMTGPVAQIIIDEGGTVTIPWDAPLSPTPILLDRTISFKQNVNTIDDEAFYRNALRFSGELDDDLLAPESDTYNTQSIQVYVNPITHPLDTNILPDPGVDPGVIWINGERIEYRRKDFITADTWVLSLLRRGTNGTGITDHPALIPTLADPLDLVPNPVWVEAGNIMPGTSDVDVWNTSGSPAPDFATRIGYDGFPFDNHVWDVVDGYSNVQSVFAGGLWYAQTTEAIFLTDEEGRSIP